MNLLRIVLGLGPHVQKIHAVPPPTSGIGYRLFQLQGWCKEQIICRFRRGHRYGCSEGGDNGLPMVLPCYVCGRRTLASDLTKGI